MTQSTVMLCKVTFVTTRDLDDFIVLILSLCLCLTDAELVVFRGLLKLF